MRASRVILTTLAVLIAPFIVLFGLLFGIHAYLYDGFGPDDGEAMIALMIAMPAAALTAISLWSISLVFLVYWIANKIANRNKLQA